MNLNWTCRAQTLRDVFVNRFIWTNTLSNKTCIGQSDLSRRILGIIKQKHNLPDITNYV